MEKRECTKAECKYYDELKALEERNAYQEKYDGSYEASKGDYEGAILARDEFNAGYIS